MAMVDGLERDVAPGTVARVAIEARDEERRRIARELHDIVGQAMSVVRMDLAATRGRIEGATSADLIDEGIAVVDWALAEVRRLARDLRPEPLPAGDLIDAIRDYLQSQERRVGYTASLRADGLDGRLGSRLATTCYWIVREALTNIARHARAEHVEVRLRAHAHELEVHVRDDGIGFDIGSMIANDSWRSLGLLGMAERVALHGSSLEIDSQPGGGTLVRARFPLPDGPSPPGAR